MVTLWRGIRRWFVGCVSFWCSVADEGGTQGDGNDEGVTNEGDVGEANVLSGLRLKKL